MRVSAQLRAANTVACNFLNWLKVKSRTQLRSCGLRQGSLWRSLSMSQLEYIHESKENTQVPPPPLRLSGGHVHEEILKGSEPTVRSSIWTVQVMKTPVQKDKVSQYMWVPVHSPLRSMPLKIQNKTWFEKKKIWLETRPISQSNSIFPQQRQASKINRHQPQLLF